MSLCVGFAGDVPLVDNRDIDIGGRVLFKPLSFLRLPDPYSGGVVVSIVIPVDLFDFFLHGFFWRRTRW